MEKKKKKVCGLHKTSVVVTRCWWREVIWNKCLVADCPCAESPAAAAVWLMKNNKSWKAFSGVCVCVCVKADERLVKEL